MADPVAATIERVIPYKHLKERFPVLGEFVTALIGAFSSELLWKWIRGFGSQTAEKVMRTSFPHFNRSLADEAAFTVIMEQLTDGEQKGLEETLSKLTFRQRVDVILSMAETLCPPDAPFDLNTPEGREHWTKERAKGIAAAVRYLKYLAKLDDHALRVKSLRSRNFMRKEGEYPELSDYLQKLQGYIEVMNDSRWARRVRAQNRLLTRENARLRAAQAVPMPWSRRLRFFTLTGGPTLPAGAVPPPTIWARLSTGLPVAGNWIAANRQPLYWVAGGVAALMVLVILGAFTINFVFHHVG